MPNRRITFSKFIIEDQRRRLGADPDLTALLNDIQTACKYIASAVSRGALNDPSGTVVTTINVQGEEQKKLDVISNEIMIHEIEFGGGVCGMVSKRTTSRSVSRRICPKAGISSSSIRSTARRISTSTSPSARSFPFCVRPTDARIPPRPISYRRARRRSRPVSRSTARRR
jgi:hypothetical protein